MDFYSLAISIGKGNCKIGKGVDIVLVGAPMVYRQVKTFNLVR